MPDDVALEKVNALSCLGATVERVRPASIINTKHVRPPPLGRSRPCPPGKPRAEIRIPLGFSTWYDVLMTTGADGADLENRVRQNLARQYAANFGKLGAKDPPNHHLIQNTESVLVTTTMDLAPPRGDGVDRPDNSAKLELSPRGFFADQFEVCFFLSTTRLPRPDDPVRFYVRWVVRSVTCSNRPQGVLATRSLSSARGLFLRPGYGVLRVHRRGIEPLSRSLFVISLPSTAVWFGAGLPTPVCHSVVCGKSRSPFTFAAGFLHPVSKCDGAYERYLGPGTVLGILRTRDPWRSSRALRSMLRRSRSLPKKGKLVALLGFPTFT